MDHSLLYSSHLLFVYSAFSWNCAKAFKAGSRMDSRFIFYSLIVFPSLLDNLLFFALDTEKQYTFESDFHFVLLVIDAVVRWL